MLCVGGGVCAVCRGGVCAVCRGWGLCCRGVLREGKQGHLSPWWTCDPPPPCPSPSRNF